MRHNDLIWGIAKWLNDHIGQFYDHPLPFEELSHNFQNDLYDKAAILYTMIITNQFTGGDNHSD